MVVRELIRNNATVKNSLSLYNNKILQSCVFSFVFGRHRKQTTTWLLAKKKKWMCAHQAFFGKYLEKYYEDSALSILTIETHFIDFSCGHTIPKISECSERTVDVTPETNEKIYGPVLADRRLWKPLAYHMAHWFRFLRITMVWQTYP